MSRVACRMSRGVDVVARGAVWDDAVFRDVVERRKRRRACCKLTRARVVCVCVIWYVHGVFDTVSRTESSRRAMRRRVSLRSCEIFVLARSCSRSCMFSLVARCESLTNIYAAQVKRLVVVSTNLSLFASALTRRRRSSRVRSIKAAKWSSPFRARAARLRSATWTVTSSLRPAILTATATRKSARAKRLSISSTSHAAFSQSTLTCKTANTSRSR